LRTGTAILNCRNNDPACGATARVSRYLTADCQWFFLLWLFRNVFVNNNPKLVTSAGIESEAEMSHKARSHELILP
jgi:hypothetical protein